jgi:polyhydroxybutyrate depolymerase
MSLATKHLLRRQREFRAAFIVVIVALVEVFFVSGKALAQDTTLVLKPSSTVIGVNGLGRLYAVYDPDGPSGPALEEYLAPSLLTWSSSKKTVASVDSQGDVLGKRRGEADILARYKGQGLNATARVTVAGTVSGYDLETLDGRTRSYLLYAPEGYNPTVPSPLVLVYHGGGGSSDKITDTSQMNVVADQNSFLAAYPNGTGLFIKTWNGGACCGYAMNNQVDDTGFTRAMITDVKARFNVDPARIYAIGYSNGAILSHRLACELSDQLAAIAAVAGGINLGGDFQACTPTRPISVMQFHGTTDDNYPYHGGVGPDGISETEFYPIVDQDRDSGVPDTNDDWLNRNGIPIGSKNISYQQGIVTCETYSQSATEVTLCTASPSQKVKVDGVIYDGGGHAWPGGVRSARQESDLPTQDIAASAASWTFFMAHPLVLPTGSVAGTVTSAANGSPIAGATVSVDTGQTTATATDGSYSMTDVPTGERLVTASANGFAPHSNPATVIQDQTVVADFALTVSSTTGTVSVDSITYATAGGPASDRHLKITVALADDVANPVGGATVSIEVFRDGSFYAPATDITGVNGAVTFQLKNAPSGCYTTTITDVTSVGLTWDGQTSANEFCK